MTYDVAQHTETLSTLLAAEIPFAVITLVAIRGSAPQVAGAKVVITADGVRAGTIGGGKIEVQAARTAQSMLSQRDGKQCELVTWNLQTDVGMTCGGEVTLFFEIHRGNQWSIAVFGAGHIAQALVPLLLQLHCHVTCVDPRSDWMDRLPDHPKLKKICAAEPREVVASLPEQTFFVLMSKGHATDLPVLQEVLQTRNAPYIGVIGSPQKASVLRRDLAAAGLPSETIGQFYCPMGLPLGNNTPAEIAISVVAQLIEQRDRLRIVDHKVKDF
jgi:xanthine dehydrogenase accessory factor